MFEIKRNDLKNNLSIWIITLTREIKTLFKNAVQTVFYKFYLFFIKNYFFYMFWIVLIRCSQK